MMWLYWLVLIPAVSAVININISGYYPTNYTITSSGIDKSTITENERQCFNVSDKILKNCVNNYLGRRPDDVYTNAPTPWGNLFKTHGWTETYRIMKPISTRIVNVISSPQVLRQLVVVSNKTNNIEISQPIYNRFSTTWIVSPKLDVKKIIYNLDVDNFRVVYETPIGDNGVKLKAMCCNVNVTDLSVGSVVAEVYATRVNIKTEVLYKSSLWGSVILNYAKAFRGHHFYSPNLDDIMADCGLNNSLLIREVVDVSFYVDGAIVVRNKSDDLRLLAKEIEILPQ